MKSRFYFSLLFVLTFSTFLIGQEKIYTCINEKGEKLFSIKAKSVGSFNEGMAEVQKAGLENGKSFFRTGFVNSKGVMVIEPKYERVYSFNSGVSWVKEPGDDSYYLINKMGERITTESWKRVGHFFNGFGAVFNDEGKMGFVNRKGALVIPYKYLGDGFSEGLACVMPYDNQVANYGFIDTTGAIVIPFQYNQAGTSSFENGECRVQIAGATCLINHRGEVVFRPTLTKNGQGFYDGLCASYTNSSNRSGWGYYNRNNVWVIKPQYDNADSFIGGLAVVEKAGKYGVIDTTGKIIIPIQYASIYANPSESGYFGVEMVENGAKEHLDAAGKPFPSFPVKYLYSHNGSSLLPYCDLNNKYGFLNRDGSIFLNAQFDRANTFQEGKTWVEGNTSTLKYAEGVTEAQFFTEYIVGEKVKAKKNGEGEFFPATVEQIAKYYYLVKFTDGSQEWVTYDSTRR